MLRMAEKASQFMRTWGGLLVAGIMIFVQVVIMGVLIPWGKSMNEAQAALAIEVRELKTWAGGHEKSVEVQKDALKGAIMAEVQGKIESAVKNLEAKQDRLADELRLSTREVGVVGASITVLTRQMSDLATVVGQLKSDLRTIFINEDFRRNQQQTQKGE